MFGESIKSTHTVTEAERDLLIEIAVQHLLISLREAQPRTSPGVPVGPNSSC